MQKSSLAYGLAALAAGMATASDASNGFGAAVREANPYTNRRGYRQGRRFNYGRSSFNTITGRGHGNPAGTKLAKKAMRGQIGMAKPR
jgi:hypothetical protein